MSLPSSFSPPLGRRRLLAAGGALVGAYALMSCNRLETRPDNAGNEPVENTKEPKGLEPPELAKLVKSGDIPPVADRLPARPLIVEPTDRIGTYGGDWTTLLEGAPTGSFGWLTTTVNHEGLMRWDPQFTELVPNVAEAFEISGDGTQITFTLRDGMRWSDGVPFTADDLLFAYNDVALNTDLYPTPPSYAVSGGTPGALEKLSDYEVRFTFSPPNGLFLQYLATPNAFNLTERPRHYLMQYHKEENPDVEQKAKDEGYPGWAELFLAKATLSENPDVPRLHPWIPRTSVAEHRVIFERNPFYWKVDPDGSQLPYLNRVTFEHVNDHEVSVLKASNGELDFESRRFFDDLANKPVLAQSRESGGYDFATLRSLYTLASGLYLNLTHEDPVKREIFGNREFRIGLSHAINRQEIIDTVFKGQGEPWQVAPLPDSPWYDEEMAKQYTEYDVDLANSFLDRAGYSERDGNGIRLGPDGNPIAFSIEVESDRAQRIDSAELIAQHLREVGVNASVKTEGRTLTYERRGANLHDATSRPAEGGGGILPPLRPDFWFPSGGESYNYAPLWSDWYTSDGNSGEEPPDDVRQQMELYQTGVRPAIDEDERIEAMREVLRLGKEHFLHIGICRYPDGFGIVKNTFHNVPKEFPQGWLFPSPGPTNPEQYFTSA